MDPDKYALIVGAGNGTGAALCRRFASAGYKICAARRDLDAAQSLANQLTEEGFKAVGFGLDARDEAQVESTFRQIETEHGPLEVVIYNAAIGARKPIAELKASTFRSVWETDCFAAFLVGREAARVMQPRGSGSIIFSGATSATRGRAEFAAFAAAKSGARALAQSMARELAPQGIHVAHIIIDGPIDGDFVRENLPDLVAARPADGILNPDDIAASYLAIHQQPRSAWTFEMDLRPFVEPW